MRVYYATLFPCVRKPEALDNRVAADALTDFTDGQFVPLIVDTC